MFLFSFLSFLLLLLNALTKFAEKHTAIFQKILRCTSQYNVYRVLKTGLKFHLGDNIVQALFIIFFFLGGGGGLTLNCVDSQVFALYILFFFSFFCNL